MTIESTPVSVTIRGAVSINLYRLLALRGAMRLEAKGIKMSRGVSALMLVKKELGLDARFPAKKAREAFESYVEQVEELYRGERFTCTQCGEHAVVPLTDWQKVDINDGTTHVCHPWLKGCNHGFKYEGIKHG
jgi:hypothetical protein